MGLILGLVLWTGLALLAVLVLVLATPVLVTVRAEAAQHWRARLRLRALGGLTPAITLYDSDRKASGRARPRPERRKPKGRAGAGRRWPGRLRAARILPALPRLISGLTGALQLRLIGLDADFGLSDPAETGQLYGLLCPLLHGVGATGPRAVALRPDFAGARLEGWGAAELRVIPAALLWPVLRFGWEVFSPWRKS